MTQRRIYAGGATVSHPDMQKFDDAWLRTQAREQGWTHALAHADDGVIWGEWRADAWVWSHAAFPEVSPPFRMLTLRELRCFGPRSELFVWRDSAGFRGRVLADGGAGAHFDESVLLWGDSSEPVERDGFALLVHGAQGIRHAPPAPFARSGRVVLRHYLAEDEDGCLRTIASRMSRAQE
jgi:CRISPR-associated protein (TIGR03984 family)